MTFRISSLISMDREGSFATLLNEMIEFFETTCVDEPYSQ